MSRTLKPEDQIAHYRVVGALGAGGMGEVYRATDQTLERDVALKVLPPELVRSEERVRRFTLEARSASSLNHPHIVTIYEIGEDRVRGRDGSARAPLGSVVAGAVGAESDSSPLHYIAMELVSGKTLSAEIHEEKAEVKSLLRWLAQAAEGVAKAHAAGIVHRDLKPGNIMVSSDGYAKVLDFGLAKLTERKGNDRELSAATTMTVGEQTSDGVVLGTVGYMAPEQVRGQAVDARADVFAFGCMLYEAATRLRPFAADSPVETLHRILHDTPAPVEELNPEAPGELRRLIRRCLAKDPAQRPQSMRDLALELRGIVDEYDALSTSASSRSGAAAMLPSPRHPRRLRASAIAVALVFAAVLVGLWVLRLRPSHDETTSFESMQMAAVTSRGDILDAALSPDGRYLAYASGLPGQVSLWVRQLQTETDVQIAAPQEKDLVSLTFSPDGNYLFYLSGIGLLRRSYTTLPSCELYQVSSIGGTPRRRGLDVESRISIAPDGKAICFARGSVNKLDALVALDLETGQERTVATSAERLVAPSWSPDGKRIVAAEYTPMVGTRVATFDLGDGRHRYVETLKPMATKAKADSLQVWDTHWLPNGRGILLLASNRGGALFLPQIWLVSYPAGGTRRVTNDLNAYVSLSTTFDGSSIGAVVMKRVFNLWVAEARPGGVVRQLTSASTYEKSPWLARPAEDGSILFFEGPSRETMERVSADGSGERTVLTGHLGPGFFSLPGGGVVFSRGKDRVYHVMRSEAKGEGERQLLKLSGGEQVVALSPDGRAVLFRPVERQAELWMIAVDGGVPVKIAASTEPPGATASRLGQADFSRDGRWIRYADLEETEGQSRKIWKVVPAVGGEPVATLKLPVGAVDEEWAPKGNSMTFVDTPSGVGNIYQYPTGGGSPRAGHPFHRRRNPGS